MIFLKIGDTRLCLFAAGNDPIERERTKMQKRKGKEGLGSGARGGEVLRPLIVTGRIKTR